MHGLENTTITNLPLDLADPIALRSFLVLLVQQLDIITGLSSEVAASNYVKVIPSTTYVQAEVTAIADQLKALTDKVETQLAPINN